MAEPPERGAPALLFAAVRLRCYVGEMKTGDKAPDFTLPTQQGSNFNLGEALQKGSVVLYFYPFDETPGCTAEACSFRDAYETFKDAGAQVVGISSDSTEKHQRFATNHRLPFTLLSDTGGKIRKLYGVSNGLGVLPGRVTFVIDPKGMVRHVFNSLFNATRHVTEALGVVKQLKPTAP